MPFTLHSYFLFTMEVAFFFLMCANTVSIIIAIPQGVFVLNKHVILVKF